MRKIYILIILLVILLLNCEDMKLVSYTEIQIVNNSSSQITFKIGPNSTESVLDESSLETDSATKSIPVPVGTFKFYYRTIANPVYQAATYSNGYVNYNFIKGEKYILTVTSAFIVNVRTNWFYILISVY